MTITIKNGKFEKFIFPGGEVSVKIIELPTNSVTIFAELKNSEDVMTLLLLVDAIRRCGAKVTRLHIPYFPYARQDRVCANGEAFSLKVMADLINSLNIPSVWVDDAHSDVTPALLNNSYSVCQTIFAANLVKGSTIICPDAGAEKKIRKFKKPYIMATKVRDPNTGDILRTEVYATEDEIKGKSFIIIDDICDGGRTFIEIAKVLKAKGANRIELYVTHGIFSQGLDVFKGYIDTVYHVVNSSVNKIII